LNALAWLGRIVPAVIEDDAERLLEGTGITMIPTYFQDLALWLPLLAIGAAWLWGVVGRGATSSPVGSRCGRSKV
jgi:hypothetical protein